MKECAGGSSTRCSSGQWRPCGGSRGNRLQDRRSALRFLGRDEVDQVVECYGRFVEKNHGTVCKFEEEIRDMRADDDIRRLVCFRESRLAGYAAFTFVNTSGCNYTLNLMDVKELAYEDEEVRRTLLHAEQKPFTNTDY